MFSQETLTKNNLTKKQLPKNSVKHEHLNS